MSIKDFQSVSAVFPLHYQGEFGPTMVPVLVEATRDGQTVITIHGEKHANSFIELILKHQLSGFTMNLQSPQKGFPGDNVEVTTLPSSENICMNHVVIQHRDAKEPWCDRCTLNKDYDPPRTIAFGTRIPRVGDSIRKHEESRLEGP